MIAAVLGVAISPVSPAAAQPWPPPPACVGATCVGRSPILCDDEVRTVTSWKVPDWNAYVELRYSANCAANWARYPSGSHPPLWMWAQTWDGRRTARVDLQYGGDGNRFTSMVDGTQLARVCAQNKYTPSDPDDPDLCSPWY
ncbi:DUF2690 domain-containing protein [Nonomuraea sp. NPDC004702]